MTVDLSLGGAVQLSAGQLSAGQLSWQRPRGSGCILKLVPTAVRFLGCLPTARLVGEGREDLGWAGSGMESRQGLGTQGRGALVPLGQSALALRMHFLASMHAFKDSPNARRPDTVQSYHPEHTGSHQNTPISADARRAAAAATNLLACTSGWHGPNGSQTTCGHLAPCFC